MGFRPKLGDVFPSIYFFILFYPLDGVSAISSLLDFLTVREDTSSFSQRIFRLTRTVGRKAVTLSGLSPKILAGSVFQEIFLLT